MMLTGCPLDSSRYPRTVLCDDSSDSVCSSSGDIPGAAAATGDAFEVLVPFGCEMNEVRAGAACAALSAA